ELPAMREWLATSRDPSLSTRAQLRGVKTHVVGEMCHVLWSWTTGDAVGPNMMTRNSYALNMAYVMQRGPVKPERAILEANMGGDKKPSAEYFQSGHGKTVLAEAFLSDEQIRRVLRTTAEDLEALSWAGTHGSVASGMQSVAFTPASAVAAVFAATGQDLGMVGTSSMAHGTARRVAGGLQATIRFGGLEVGSARRALACDSLLLGGRATVIAIVFRYDVREPEAFEGVYGPNGEWARFFRQGAGYIGTELLRDVEEFDRYVVIDRWESAD